MALKVTAKKYIKAIVRGVEMVSLAPVKVARINHEARIGRTLSAQKYARGRGVEIGAFDSPTNIPWASDVTFVDRVEKSYWSEHSEYADLPIVDPHIICEADKL